MSIITRADKGSSLTHTEMDANLKQIPNGEDSSITDDNDVVQLGSSSKKIEVRTTAPDIGENLDDEQTMMKLQTYSTNNMQLKVKALRTTAGTNWHTVGLRLQADVDDTKMGYIQFNGDNDNGITLGSNNTERVRLDASGNVGIGIIPTVKLHVDGSIIAGATTLSTLTAGATTLSTLGVTGATTLSTLTAGATSVSTLSASGLASFGNDVDVSGYTELGSTAPSIKMKKLTGVTGSSEGDNTNITHGLDSTKILNVDVIVRYDTDDARGIKRQYKAVAGYKYDYYIHESYIVVMLDDTKSENILSKNITVLLTYEE